RGRQRCQPFEQEPAAFRPGRSGQPAGAGDPCRRGQGRARCHRRPARSDRDVLPALARPARGRRAPAADRGLLPRGPGRGRRRRGARSAVRTPRPRAAGTGRRGMSIDRAAVDWAAVRAEFPLLQREVHGKPLVYLDSANTGQKPAAVIDATDDFYRRHNANVSRAVHALGSEATEAYEAARGKLARHLNVRADELVLTSGTTFAINLAAYSWALPRLKPGD